MKEESHLKSKLFHNVFSARKWLWIISPATEIPDHRNNIAQADKNEQHNHDGSLPVIPNLPVFKSTNVLSKCG